MVHTKNQMKFNRNVSPSCKFTLIICSRNQTNFDQGVNQSCVNHALESHYEIKLRTSKMNILNSLFIHHEMHAAIEWKKINKT